MGTAGFNVKIAQNVHSFVFVCRSVVHTPHHSIQTQKASNKYIAANNTEQQKEHHKEEYRKDA
jgi:hypothetical protein